MPSFFVDDSNYGIAALPSDPRMSSAMRIFVVSCILTLLTAPLFFQTARAEEPTQSGRGVSARLDRLATQVEAVEKAQHEILTRQNETIETIKNLKIWVHRK